MFTTFALSIHDFAKVILCFKSLHMDKNKAYLAMYCVFLGLDRCVYTFCARVVVKFVLVSIHIGYICM